MREPDGERYPLTIGHELASVLAKVTVGRLDQRARTKEAAVNLNELELLTVTVDHALARHHHLAGTAINDRHGGGSCGAPNACCQKKHSCVKSGRPRTLIVPSRKTVA